VTTSLAHEHIARQRFLTRGPLAFLPLADPHQCGIVWSTTPEQARELLAMPGPEFCQALQLAFEHRLGEITSCGKRGAFDLYRSNAPAYIADRLVLAGDAAHTVHPLAGQGANMGLLDVAVLAELILDARSKQRAIYSRQLLRRYERWRRTDNQCMQLTLDGIRTLFASQNNALVKLRSFGLDTLNSIPWIKSGIMLHAMGREGNLPAVAKRPMYPEMI
jgi:2-octaprenylphenol hydroxylase